MTKQYRFIFRTECGEIVEIQRECRPGDAETWARKIAQIVAKRLGGSVVTCIWMKPAEEKLPKQFRMEVIGA